MFFPLSNAAVRALVPMATTLPEGYFARYDSAVGLGPLRLVLAYPGYQRAHPAATLGEFLAPAPADLQEQAARCAVHFAVVEALPGLDVGISGGGLTVASTSMLAPASRDRVANLLAQQRRAAYLALSYLHTHPARHEAATAHLFCSTGPATLLCADPLQVKSLLQGHPDAPGAYFESWELLQAEERRAVTSMAGAEAYRLAVEARLRGEAVPQPLQLLARAAALTLAPILGMQPPAGLAAQLATTARALMQDDPDAIPGLDPDCLQPPTAPAGGIFVA